jgi:GGDEF domain-containing protein
MESHRFVLEGDSISVTSSQGIATYPVNPKILGHEDLVREADKALYSAKEAGRNRTILDSHSIRGRD